MKTRTHALLKRSIVAGCAAVCISAPFLARADQPQPAADTRQDLDNVVVTATMTGKNLQDVPGSVEVITAQEIKEMNATTVAEALENATGLIVSSETGRVKAPSIRGTKSKQTLVLIDGRRMAVGYGDLININQIPVVMVERIEVVRGPSSSLYGSDAIGGVVNIITKKPVKKWKMEANGQAGINREGEGGAYLGSAYGNGYYDRFSLLVGGEYNAKNKWNRTDNDNQDDGDKTGQGSGAGRFAVDLARDHTLSGGFEYSDNSMEGVRFIEGAVRNRDADDTRLGYYLQYDGTFANNYQMMLRLNRSEFTNKITLTPASTTSEEGTKDNNLNQAEARFSGLFFKQHLVTAGFEYREEERKDATAKQMDVNNVSLYLQDEYQIFKPLYLVLGGRFDDNSKFGSQWTPRASLIYDILDNLRLKGSYGRGFRAPSITELFVTSWRQKGKYIYEPNQNLKAEKSESYEVGIEGEYGSYRGSLTLFRNELKDMIDAVYYKSVGTGQTKKDYYQFKNISKAMTQGIELESSVKLPMGFDLSGNATWLETEDKSTGKELAGQPNFKGYVKLGYTDKAHAFHANIRTSFTGRTYNGTGSDAGYPLLHCYLSKGLTDTFKIYAGVENILDRTEKEPTFVYTGVNITF